MNEFIEKLIGRLEEEENRNAEKIEQGNVDVAYVDGVAIGFALARNIVNQLAEEYNNKTVKGDLISKSVLIEDIWKISKDITSEWETAGVLSIVERQPIAENNGWIPCSERLPIGKEYHKRIDGVDYYKHMLVATNDIDAPICVGWYDQEDETWFVLEGFAFYPVAWMPLPEPYIPNKE